MEVELETQGGLCQPETNASMETENVISLLLSQNRLTFFLFVFVTVLKKIFFSVFAYFSCYCFYCVYVNHSGWSLLLDPEGLIAAYKSLNK